MQFYVLLSSYNNAYPLAAVEESGSERRPVIVNVN